MLMTKLLKTYAMFTYILHSFLFCVQKLWFHFWDKYKLNQIVWHDGSAFCTIVLPNCLYTGRKACQTLKLFLPWRLLPLVILIYDSQNIGARNKSALISWILDIILKTVHFRSCETKNIYKNCTKNVNYEVILLF